MGTENIRVPYAVITLTRDMELYGLVAQMVRDAPDLGSGGRKPCVGSTPTKPTKWGDISNMVE